MIGNSNDYINLSHILLLNDRQLKNLCKAFANNLLADIKISNTQVSLIIQLENSLSHSLDR